MTQKQVQEVYGYLRHCEESGDVPFIEQASLVFEIPEEEMQKDEEFLARLSRVQKLTLLKRCSPQFLLQYYGHIDEQKTGFPERVELVIGGKEENGKVGIKVTPGSKIVKFMEHFMGKKEESSEK